MAGTALSGRLTWRFARVVDRVAESARAKSIVLELPGWLGHRAGQHVDIRLTAEDGYVYISGPGIVARCPGCASVAMVLARRTARFAGYELSDGFAG